MNMEVWQRTSSFSMPSTYADADRHATRLFEILTASVKAFEAEPPHSDPFVYAKLFFLLIDDFPGFGGGSRPDIIRAEKEAFARRGPPDLPLRTGALLRKWRESLDASASTALDWLLYTSRARELGETAEAREALSKAIELGVSDISEWTVVFETWQLYGLEEGLAAVARIPDKNYRASTYLKIADRLLTQGERPSARAVFEKFIQSYDEDEPVRPAASPRRMARSAALLSYRFGDTGQALFWADKYAQGSPFASRTVTALEAADLYVEIGVNDKAVAKAYEAIAHSPKPGQTARGPWLSTVSTTPFYNKYVGRAIGVLCKAGRLAEAFSLTEGNPDIGSNAVGGCRVAMEGTNPRMTLRSLAESLSLRSIRQLQQIRAARLVGNGDYDAASRLISSALISPPAVEEGTLAFANLPYLRLAVAMRNEDLVRDIMRFIVANASSVDGKSATALFATIATWSHKWPGHSL